MPVKCRLKLHIQSAFYAGCIYTSLTELKLIHVSKRGQDKVSGIYLIYYQKYHEHADNAILEMGMFQVVHLKWRHKYLYLTLWGRVTHICVSKVSIIGSDNVLSPDRRQAIIWTNAGIMEIWTLGTNFNEIIIGKWRLFCLGLNVLSGCKDIYIYIYIYSVYNNVMGPGQKVYLKRLDSSYSLQWVHCNCLMKHIVVNHVIWLTIRLWQKVYI